MQTTKPSRSHSDVESMQVDNTKDRVFIHNLDDEISEAESEEEKLVFLPDIEKKLGKLPKSVLLSESHPSTATAMVLYSVPTSLSIPEGQDKVRKAIIESRARAMEKQIQDTGITNNLESASSNFIDHSPASEQYEEAMDLG